MNKMNIQDIKHYNEVYQNIHESVFKSYQILELVKEMLERGDSRETVLMVVKYLELNHK